MESGSMITYQIESWDEYYKDSQKINEEDYEEIWPHKEKMELRPNIKFYENLQNRNMLSVVTVRDNRELIGFHITIIAPNSHSMNTLCAYQDACYLRKNYRGAIGVRLMEYAKQQSIKRGAKMLIWTTPAGKGKRLERMGFTKTDEVYSQWVGD